MPRAIYPGGKKRVSWRKPARKAIDVALALAATDIAQDFARITGHWNHKPMILVKFGNYRVKVYTLDPPMFYMDGGTKDHWVGPRNKHALAFQSGHKAKTQPNSMQSYPGGSYGPVWFSKGHKVSGIEPRNFSKNMAYMAVKYFVKRYDVAIQKELGG